MGVDISHETISAITDAVLDEVMIWQNRQLDDFYPVIFLDALRIKVRDGGRVINKSAYLAIGVDMDGIKHILGVFPWEVVNGTSDICSLVQASNDRIVVKRRLHRPAHQILCAQSPSDFDTGRVGLVGLWLRKGHRTLQQDSGTVPPSRRQANHPPTCFAYGGVWCSSTSAVPADPGRGNDAAAHWPP